MNRMARSMMAAALAAVLGLGTAAPAAVAAPPAGKAAGKHDGGGRHDRADRTDRKAGPKAADKPGRAGESAKTGKDGKSHESCGKASKGLEAGRRLQRAVAARGRPQGASSRPPRRQHQGGSAW